jgi:hypothetical protein
MLEDQIFGKVNSWAIRWQSVMVLNNWYCIHANISYTQHVAFDAQCGILVLSHSIDDLWSVVTDSCVFGGLSP